MKSIVNVPVSGGAFTEFSKNAVSHNNNPAVWTKKTIRASLIHKLNMSIIDGETHAFNKWKKDEWSGPLSLDTSKWSQGKRWGRYLYLTSDMR